jgi:hypothetical protein
LSAFLTAGMSHSLIFVSWLPDTSVLPSGLYAKEVTYSVCLLRVACSLPVATSHSLKIGVSHSPEAEASVLPSGLKATGPEPLSVASSLPDATSHSLTLVVP